MLYASCSLAQNNQTSKMGEMEHGKLVYSDEFNIGNFPNSKDWMLRANAKMGGISSPNNVSQTKLNTGESCLQINFTYDSTRRSGTQYAGGGVVSTHNFGYGYYEIKVKLYGGKPENAGFHQSFWSMGLTGTNEAEGRGVRDALVAAGQIPQENRVLEIDGFEHNSMNNILGQNYHIYTPAHISQTPHPSNFQKDLSEWITVGYEWLPGSISFFTDGKLVSTLKLESKWNIYAPQNIWLTALPVNVKGWGGLQKPSPGAAMKIDYFRYYTKHLPGANRLGNADFEYDSTYPVAWIVEKANGNDAAAVKVLSDSTFTESGKRCLIFTARSLFRGGVKQVMEYIPDGEYTLSFLTKSSVNIRSAMVYIDAGKVKTQKNITPNTQWHRVTIPRIKVTGNQAIIEFTTNGIENEFLAIDDVRFYEK